MLILVGWKQETPRTDQLYHRIYSSEHGEREHKEAQSLSVHLPQAPWRDLGFVSQRGRITLQSQGSSFMVVTDVMGMGTIFIAMSKERQVQGVYTLQGKEEPVCLSPFWVTISTYHRTGKWQGTEMYFSTVQQPMLATPECLVAVSLQGEEAGKRQALHSPHNKGQWTNPASIPYTEELFSNRHMRS